MQWTTQEKSNNSKEIFFDFIAQKLKIETAVTNVICKALYLSHPSFGIFAVNNTL